MKSLALFVEELLYEHQCVIIPDFGAFVSNRKVAQLLKDSTIVPPAKEISFNARLHVNDGILVKHVAQQEHISYQAAQEYVRAEVEQWKYVLGKEEELVLDKIGKFHQTPQDSVVFEPFAQENFLTDSFGLSAVSVNEISKSASLAGSSAMSDVLAENPMTTKEEKKQAFVLPSWAKYALSGVVGLGIIYYGVYAFLQSLTKPSQEVAVASGKQKISEASFVGSGTAVAQKEISADTISATAKALSQKQLELEKEQAQLAQLEKQEHERQQREKQQQVVAVPKTTSKGKSSVASVADSDPRPYHLVAGAFSSLANAHNKVAELKKDGFKDAVVVGKNAKGLFLVSYKSFDQDTQARAYISKVKENGYDTWLYKKE